MYEYQQPRFGGPAGPSPTTLSTAALLGQVLGLTSVGFVVTAITAYFTASLVLPLGASIIAIFAGFGFLIAISATRANPSLSLLMFYAFTGCEGIGIGRIITTYTRLNGPGVVVEAAATTAMGMLTLAAIASLTSFDYRRLSGIAYGLVIGLFLASLIGLFTHYIHPDVIAWATLVVFALLTLIDFARIRAGGAGPDTGTMWWMARGDFPGAPGAFGDTEVTQRDGATAIELATQIYLDSINIFIALLWMFGKRRRNDNNNYD